MEGRLAMAPHLAPSSRGRRGDAVCAGDDGGVEVEAPAEPENWKRYWHIESSGDECSFLTSTNL